MTHPSTTTDDPSSILIEMAFRPFPAIIEWLQKLPHIAVTDAGDGYSYIVKHKDLDFTCGICPLNIVDMAIALAFAVIGPQWPFVAKTLFQLRDLKLKRLKAESAP